MINEKRLTTEFILLEIAAIERKINAEIESERCIPIINKVYMTKYFYFNLFNYIILYIYIELE